MVPPRFVATLAFWVLMSVSVRAEIYRWDNGQLIPFTEGITPGSSNLSGWATDSRNLRYADFSGDLDLSGGRFFSSWLEYATFEGANLSNGNFVRSTLTDANLSGANLGNAVLAESMLTGANLSGVNLSNANLNDSILTEANLSGSNLINAVLAESMLTGANLSGVNLSNVNLGSSTLSDANLSGATVTGANFRDTTSRGFTQEQLSSTASYQAKNLQGIVLSHNNLVGWDFSGQILTDADLFRSTLTDIPT